MATQGDANESDSRSTKPRRPVDARYLFFYIERKRIADGIDHRQLQITQAELQRVSEEIRSKSREEIKRERASCTLSARELASKIARNWKSLDRSTRGTFERQAARDKQAYENAMSHWKTEQAREQQQVHGHITGIFPANADRRNAVSELERLRQLREEHEIRMRQNLIEAVAFTEATSLPAGPFDLLQPLELAQGIGEQRDGQALPSRDSNSESESDYSFYSTDISESGNGDDRKSDKADKAIASIKNADSQNAIPTALEIQTLAIREDIDDNE